MSDTKISEAVGIVGSMPGTEGFTMACFKADEVPVGTPLYLHPQPAELAEQQGAEWNDSARLAYLESLAREPGGLLLHAERKTGQRGLGLGENCGNRTLAQAIDGCATHAEKDRFSALAATGKQQVGEVEWVRDIHDVEQGLIQRPAAPHAANNAPSPTIRTQVGEVQGDARAQFEAWAKSAGLETKIYAHNDMHSHPVTRGAWMAWQHLAARLRLRQEPVSIKSVRQFIADRTPNEEYREDILSGDHDHSAWFDHIRELMTALSQGNNS